MLVRARDLAHETGLEADVAIVGGGPAGITAALELARAGLEVLLLEAGPERAEGNSPAFAGQVADGARHPPLSLYRAWGLGGTSSLWGGRCVPLDPIDFEPRPHVPGSGWPIACEEMERWYRLASAYCEAGPFRRRRGEIAGMAPEPLVGGFDDSEVDTEALDLFSRPTDFGRRYRPALARTANLRAITGAICTRIVPGPSRHAISHVVAHGTGGRRLVVRAKAFVLAAGGLESTRLMLASGLGGDRDLAGRFYMCHIEGKAAALRLAPGVCVSHAYERTPLGVYVRRRFAFPTETQRRRAMTNVTLRIEPPVIADPLHGSPVLSAMWMSRALLKREYARKLASFGYRGAAPPTERQLWAAHAANVLRGLPQLARFGTDWALRRWLASRKLPFVCAAGRDGTLTLDYNAEQVPDPDSRVTLSDRLDRFGLPELSVDWRVGEDDLRGVELAHRVLAEAFGRSGAGTLKYGSEAIRHGCNAVGGHHIGTLRMAADPSRGVVDPDCRVFGLANLYIAGSAVFPTSGHANPTLTIVALAGRLAHHLAERAGRPMPVPPAESLEAV